MNYIDELYTERLIIREIVEEDIPFIFQLRSETKNMVHLDIMPYKTISEAAVFVQNRIKENKSQKNYFWIVEDKHTTETYGSICLWAFSTDRKHAEVGYHFLKEHQGKGYAFEVLEGVTKFAFNILNVERLDGVTREANTASIKLLEKGSFNYQGRARDVYADPEMELNLVVYRNKVGGTNNEV